MTLGAVKEKVKVVLDELPKKVGFDKIKIWEQFKGSLSSDKSIVTQFNKFTPDEFSTMAQPRFGPKKTSICTGHAKWVQSELSKLGIKSYVVVKTSPPGCQEKYEHTALAVQVVEGDKKHTLLIDAFQIPSITVFSEVGKPVLYGKNRGGTVRTAKLTKNGGIDVFEKAPNMTDYTSHFTTDLAVTNPDEVVTKTNLVLKPKIPWVAMNNKAQNIAAVVVDLESLTVQAKLFLPTKTEKNFKPE